MAPVPKGHWLLSTRAGYQQLMPEQKSSTVRHKAERPEALKGSLPALAENRTQQRTLVRRDAHPNSSHTARGSTAVCSRPCRSNAARAGSTSRARQLPSTSSTHYRKVHPRGSAWLPQPRGLGFRVSISPHQLHATRLVAAAQYVQIRHRSAQHGALVGVAALDRPSLAMV